MTGPDLDQFTAVLPDHLHCPVCLGAAYPPVVACSREHIVCHGCLESMCKKGLQPLCPTCREPVPATLKISPGFTRAIESYSYKCDKGQCKWVGSVGDVPQHLKDSCKYREVECLCSAKYLVKDRAAHGVECPLTSLFCPRGGKACSGVTRSGMFLRRDLAAHEKVCTMYKCPYNCNTYTTAANLVAHQKSCSALRLRIKSLERKLAISEDLVRTYQELGKKRHAVQKGAQGRAPEGSGDDDVVVEEQGPAKRKRVRQASALEIMTLESSDGDDLEARVPGEAMGRSGRRRAAFGTRGRRASSGNRKGAQSGGDPSPSLSEKGIVVE
ncbi:uncharacterized protein RHOBADRAFT_51778 [Rhodotorula graminis WP1]|uniref:RING-type domain-containing protein n=1 Tax=Rhodotorula graminis (strain WP1) TaxID=578459 RepID=A0A194S893_RHOGW|nr:uncharacterized protein RHOBADRAFT_51778 [Rhodotorula graminis WP1]KPV76784.1 hypothetical protein RHOBADRAFT_51778 [Rhodotorula graminis WP1]